MPDSFNVLRLIQNAFTLFHRLFSLVLRPVAVQLIDFMIIAAAYDRTPDARHPFRRAYTREYQARKKVVYYFWIASLLCMLMLPTIGFVTSAGMFTTFLSFSYLDEHESDSSL